MKSALKAHQACSTFAAGSTLSVHSSKCASGVFLSIHQKNTQRRQYHDSLTPHGRGGRSSFSGVAATLFGATGFIGHSVINHMASIGSSIVVPHRGSVDRLFRVKLMGDLGQLMFREFSIKNENARVAELIEYSNVVVNMIGTRIPYNHYSMEEVNVEWPKRLAQAVADKDDGTKLIHVSYLNCHQDENRKASKILQQNYEAEQAIKDIYPDATIVRVANVHGLRDRYTSLLLHKKFNKLAFYGALPLLYDAGRSTVISPVHVGDVAQAISRISRHADAPGQTFELIGPDRVTLHDFVEHIYNLQNKEFNLDNTLGPMDRSKANPIQNLLHKALEMYFWKMDQPRPMPRFLDLMTRQGSAHEMWMTHDMFRQLHISDEGTGAPGFEELGIEPIGLEEKLFENLRCNLGLPYYIRSEADNMPRVPDVVAETKAQEQWTAQNIKHVAV